MLWDIDLGPRKFVGLPFEDLKCLIDLLELLDGYLVLVNLALEEYVGYGLLEFLLLLYCVLTQLNRLLFLLHLPL